MYYLDLIATELDTKCTAIIVKTSTSGAKTTPIILYPKRLPVLRTGTAQAGAATTITLDSSASATNDFYNGCYVNITNNSPANVLGQARRITDYVGSTKVATVEAAWGTNPDSTSTFEILLTEEACAVREWAGSPVADPTTAGVPEVDLTYIVGVAVSTTTAQLGVNVVQISTDATAADNLEAVLDGTGGVTLVATAFTLTTPITANATQISGDATAADNCELFFDGTGYAAANSTVGTVTTLTNLPAITANWLTAAGLAADAVAEIADGVWDEVQSGHLTAGTFGLFLDVAISGRLAPTVAGRTLDVSAGGEAGVDWANVGSQSTSVNLSATTVNLVNTITTYTGNTPQTGDCFARLGAPAGASVSADVAAVKAETASIQTDTDNIQTRLPAALVSGRMDSSVGAMAANTLTASALATDAVDEIVDAVWDEPTSGHITAGTFGLMVGTTLPAYVDTIETRLPAALVGGRMDSSIGAVATGAITAAAFAAGAIDAAALAADAGTEIGTAVWASATRALTATGLDAVVPAEPSGAPAWGTTSIVGWQAWLGALSRNKIIQSSTSQRLRNDADAADIASASTTDADGSFTRGEFA